MGAGKRGPCWLVTGRPGVGKTTVIRRIAAALGPKAGGFLTEEVRKGGRRVGFRVEDLAGPRGILAHMDFPSPPSVGRYGVDLDAMDEIAIGAVEKAIRRGQVLMVDEIGKMELLHPRFGPVVERALESGLPLVATVLLGRHPFTDRIKTTPGAKRIEVSRSNRDSLPARILADLKAWKGDELSLG